MNGGRRRPMGWVWRHSGPYRYGLLAVAAVFVVASVNTVLFPVLFRGVIDSVTSGDLSGFLTLGGIYAALYVMETLLQSLHSHVSHRVSFRMETHLKEHLYRGLLRTEYAALQGRTVGELSNHLNNDVSIAVSGVMTLIPGLISLVIRVAGASLVLLYWDAAFFLLYAGALLVGGVFMAALRGPMQRLHQEMRSRHDQVEAVQQDTLRNTLMVRTFLGFGSAMHTWADRVEGLRRASYRQNLVSNLIHTAYVLLTDLGYLGCLAWYGMRILSGAATYGMLAGALQLVGQLQSPFGDVNRMFSGYWAMRTSALRLMELDELPREPEQQPLTGLEMDSLRLEHLSFSYGDVPVLEDVSFTVRRGEVVAFVGLSGAGKSTLLKLMLALYRPSAGSAVLVSRTGEELPLSAAVRGLFAYVPQGNGMMAGTLYQVVSFAYHRTDFTPEERQRVREACAVACADEFIRELPGQYEARVGEGGAGLSEGQLQRLAIARAIYYGAPVLLLDEATSALDEATEGRVLNNIRALRDRTVLIVTHNRQALSICDRTVRVEEGRLREQPRPDARDDGGRDGAWGR